MRTILFLLILMVSTFFAKAQSEKFNLAGNLGLSTPILNNGVGINLGLNPYYALSNYLAIEGQLSYNYTQINSTFLSGNEGSSNAVNLLLGPRLFITSSDRKLRPYVNLLVGGSYFSEEINTMESQYELGLGYSVGGYVEVRKLMFGLAYESPGNIVLKAGFVFR